MARPSMVALVRRTRLLINDPAGPDAVYTDDQVQDALDARRSEQRWLPLLPRPTFAPGSIQYLSYYSGDIGPWEADVVLQRSDYTDITTDVTLFEPLVGHFAFAAQPQGVAVRATGKTYDEYYAAGDLLSAWASRVMLEFTFKSERLSFNRSEAHKMLLAQAAQMYAQARVRTTRMVQRDASPDMVWGGGPAVTYPTMSESGGLP